MLYGLTVGLIHLKIWMRPKALLDDGNDILYTTTDSPSVVTLAQQAWKRDGKEVWSMGNDAPMGHNGPDRYVDRYDVQLEYYVQNHSGLCSKWNVETKSKIELGFTGKLCRSIAVGCQCAWFSCQSSRDN
jgi:hypothetical protein